VHAFFCGTLLLPVVIRHLIGMLRARFLRGCMLLLELCLPSCVLSRIDHVDVLRAAWQLRQASRRELDWSDGWRVRSRRLGHSAGL
jgi:hypothetical protein